MAEKELAYVTPQVLKWARLRAGFSQSELAQKVLGKPDGERIRSWEKGESLPTFRQAEILADRTYVPFGYLFLNSPPEEEVTVPDFRRKADAKPKPMSVHLKDALSHAQAQQDWYRDYRVQVGADPLKFMARYKVGEQQDIVVNSIRETLGLTPEVREGKTQSSYLTELSRLCEKAGLMVSRSSYVGTNSRRSLDPDEFRGFALVDQYAPLIFINTKDFDSAKVFTLFHEVAHIWIGESGVSDFTSSFSDNWVEQYCNEIAAELLVPRRELEQMWNPREIVMDAIRRLADHFKVSKLVIARRAFELRHISREVYDQLYAQEKALYRNLKKRKKEPGSGGGDPYVTAQARNGIFFSQAVMAQAYQGDITFTDASHLLNVGVASLDKYARKTEETLRRII